MPQLIADNWIAAFVAVFFIGYFIGKSRSGSPSNTRPGHSSPRPESTHETAHSLSGAASGHSSISLNTSVIELNSNDPLYRELVTLLNKGDKIQAIKKIREAKGCDLVTAKQLAEAIEAQSARIR